MVQEEVKLEWEQQRTAFIACIKEGSKQHNIATDNRKLYFV